MLGDDNSNVTVSVTSHSNQLVTEFLSVFLPDQGQENRLITLTGEEHSTH